MNSSRRYRSPGGSSAGSSGGSNDGGVKERAVANARGALDVVQTTSANVDEELADIDDWDTICNVSNDDAVAETLSACYAGAADRTLALERTDRGPTVELRQSPIGTTGIRRPLRTRSEPPFVRVDTTDVRN